MGAGPSCGILAALLLSVVPAHSQAVPQYYVSLARETLGPDDGWASSGTGTTGGSNADPQHVFVARNRAELVAALSGTAPKIVFVEGTIYAGVDDANRPLGCADYAAGTGYTLEAYLRAYDPAVWGRSQVPSGDLENARNAAHLNQQNRVRISIPANTTLVGLGRDARITGAYVRINNAQNVIVRNLAFEDAYDCFPQWDPTDGATGNWNSAFDNLGLLGATNVWVDHCEFNDGGHPDELQPAYFGREFVVHDGALDITNASDLVTVSWNHFARHDKLMLIGSSDTAAADAGKLRVTLHHNYFDSNVQRAPRVRFGLVHVYNNYYLADASNYSYSWGVGVQSQIFAQNNYFETNRQVAASRFISRFSGNVIFVGDTLVDGYTRAYQVDVLAEYNRTHDPDLSNSVAWVPMLFTGMDPAQVAARRVREEAGVFRKGPPARRRPRVGLPGPSRALTQSRRLETAPPKIR